MSQPKNLHLFPVGTRVTCQYRGEHQGVVLAEEDPRAWACSLAFPSATPDPVAVAAYVARNRVRGAAECEHQPVLWDFGKVYWDSNLSDVAVAEAITDEEHAAYA